MESVVALMPMRHSSERVPGKNYRDFNGLPLFHHMAKTILNCSEVSQLVINTDSETIFEQCEIYFPEVRIISRPTHLLGGEVPMTEILLYDAEIVSSDWYLQVHSTSPLIRSETISSALNTLREQLDNYDSLFSVTRLQTRLYGHDFQPLNHDPKKLLRTQDLPPIFEENSGMYVFSKGQIESGQRFGSRPMLFEIDPIEALDIDEEPDFIVAETISRLRESGSL